MPYEKEIQILSELRSEYSCFDPSERKYYHALSEAISSLKNKRYGHWIGKDDECECPFCGKTWNYMDNCTETFDYCPNCGAKMDEVEDGDIH